VSSLFRDLTFSLLRSAFFETSVDVTYRELQISLAVVECLSQLFKVASFALGQILEFHKLENMDGSHCFTSTLSNRSELDCQTCAAQHNQRLVRLALFAFLLFGTRWAAEGPYRRIELLLAFLESSPQLLSLLGSERVELEKF
jgi:hypothetical protein